METIKPKEGNREMIESIKEIAKLKYGRQKEIVERGIWERSRLGRL